MRPIATRKTTKELVYDQLKRGILNGTISKDEYLTEMKLAETLNISRTPIREAAADLENEGLLIHVQRKGFKIREINESELEQIFYLRNSIEMKGISILIDTINNSQVNQLEAIVDLQEEAIKMDDRIKYIELDQSFHRTMLRMAGQNLLEQIFKEIYNLSLLIGHAAITKEGRMDEVILEHREIIESLRNKDENGAKKHLNKHLKETGKSAKKKFYLQLQNKQ